MIRFDQAAHAYYLHEVRVPSITQMMSAEGMIDSIWYTEESRQRGTAVHEWTASFDLGAVEIESYEGAYRPYMLAHVEAMRVLRPEILEVEVPLVHERLRYGGRMDRLWRLFSALSIVELKSGPPMPWHRIQTALQAILVEQERGVPATAIKRYGLHLRGNGRYKLDPHDNPIDIGRARGVIAKQACRMEPWVPAERW
jgi:hypothetical protein